MNFYEKTYGLTLLQIVNMLHAYWFLMWCPSSGKLLDKTIVCSSIYKINHFIPHNIPFVKSAWSVASVLILLLSFSLIAKNWKLARASSNYSQAAIFISLTLNFFIGGFILFFFTYLGLDA